MERTAYKTCGQAVLELMFFATLTMTTVICTTAIVDAVKKEMKHDFINGEERSEAKLLSEANPEIAETLEKLNEGDTKMFFFGRAPLEITVAKLKDEGWSVVKTFKAPRGRIALFSKGDQKMGLVKSKGGILGIYL